MNKAMPISRKEIINKADMVRKAVNVKPDKKFPMEEFENIIECIEYTLEILEDKFMEEEAVTIPEYKIVKMKESVYDGLIEGNCRDRFTAAHELGHIMLNHNMNTIQLARGSEQIPAYKNPEWQANEFAAALLAPISECKKLDIYEIAERYNCSLEVAMLQKKKIATSGL